MILKDGQATIHYLSPKYAVEGKIKCYKYYKDMNSNPKKYDFNNMVYANIGNPQSLGQKPVTYCRQLVAAVIDPSLTEPSSPYPSDVKRKAKKILSGMPGNSSGAYTESKGCLVIREQIAKMIHARDGYPSDPEMIFLTAGATPGINFILELLIAHPNVGIMIPRPDYPIYSALITSLCGKVVFYDLNEEDGWRVSENELENVIANASCEVRAVCLINPGNPTGGLLNRKYLEGFVRFASRHNLVIMADEVYQLNIMGAENFISTKKVLLEYEQFPVLHVKTLNNLIMIASKGIICECGQRGGYFECLNVDSDGMDLMNKLYSMKLCPPTPGQVMMSAIADPPVEGDASYENYKKEIDNIRETFSRNAKSFAQAFSNYPYVKLLPPVASIYVFPSFILPPKFISEAESLNVPPDELLCSLLVEKKGVCTTPGSGFGCQKGTNSIRITITPEGMEQVISAIKYVIDWIYKEYS